jgi:hypothetical protein
MAGNIDGNSQSGCKQGEGVSGAVTNEKESGKTAHTSLASRHAGANKLATDCDEAQGVCGLSGAVRPAWIR